MTSVVKRDPLTEIKMFSGDIFFAKCSQEEFEVTAEKNKFIRLGLHENRRIASSGIAQFWNAKPVDYFRVLILPTLKPAVRSRIEDSINIAIENGVELKLEGILNRIKQIEQDII